MTFVENEDHARMTKIWKIAKTALVALSATASLACGAHAYSEKVKKACAGDYQSFCSQYVPESTQARRCFENNHKSLSKFCITALVNAGEVPARYLRK
ncbi:MAG: hypothetical protein ACKVP4_03635 [Hyphomicrobium sp.]